MNVRVHRASKALATSLIFANRKHRKAPNKQAQAKQMLEDSNIPRFRCYTRVLAEVNKRGLEFQRQKHLKLELLPE